MKFKTSDALDGSVRLFRTNFTKHTVYSVIFYLIMTMALILVYQIGTEWVLPQISFDDTESVTQMFRGFEIVAAPLCFFTVFFNLILKTMNVVIVEKSVRHAKGSVFVGTVRKIPKLFVLAVFYSLLIFSAYVGYIKLFGYVNVAAELVIASSYGVLSMKMDHKIVLLAFILIIYSISVLMSYYVSANVFEREKFFKTSAKSVKYSAQSFFINIFVFFLWRLFRIVLMLAIASLLSFVIKSPVAEDGSSMYEFSYQAIRFIAASVLLSPLSPIMAIVHTLMHLNIIVNKLDYEESSRESRRAGFGSRFAAFWVDFLLRAVLLISALVVSLTVIEKTLPEKPAGVTFYAPNRLIIQEPSFEYSLNDGTTWFPAYAPSHNIGDVEENIEELKILIRYQSDPDKIIEINENTRIAFDEETRKLNGIMPSFEYSSDKGGSWLSVSGQLQLVEDEMSEFTGVWVRFEGNNNNNAILKIDADGLNNSEFSLENMMGSFWLPLLILIIYAVYFITSVFYDVICEMMFNGVTIGKKLLGLKVISESFRKLTFRQSIIRNILKYSVDMTFMPIAALADTKTLGDRVANVAVVTNANLTEQKTEEKND